MAGLIFMEVATRRREKEVWQACDDLWADNGDFKNLTGDAIRERLLFLGFSRGSPNEIYKYRKTWGLSRGVSENSEVLTDDPITRAVRLVHENIKNEADEKIAQLNEEFSKKEENYINRIKEKEDSISNLILEFSSLENLFNKMSEENASLKEKLHLEGEEKKNLNRDLAEIKRLNMENKSLYENMLIEVNKKNNEEIQRLKELYCDHENSLKEQVRDLENKQKNAGIEYSEILNDLKTKNYNLNISCDRQEQKIALLSASLIEQQKINDDMRDQINNISNALMEHKILTKNYKENEKNLRNELKKSITSLARMRGIVACGTRK